MTSLCDRLSTTFPALHMNLCILLIWLTVTSKHKVSICVPTIDYRDFSQKGQPMVLVEGIYLVEPLLLKGLWEFWFVAARLFGYTAAVDI